MNNFLPPIRWLLVLYLFLNVGTISSQNLANAKLIIPSGDELPQQKQALSEKLKELEKTFQVNFMFDPELVEGKTTSNQEIAGGFDEQLRKILQPLQLSYRKVDENYYVIQKADAPRPAKIMQKPQPTEKAAPLPSTNSAQLSRLSTIDLRVSGKVTDDNDNTPLPGVNVLVKNSDQGTITDIDGNYSLTVPNNNDTLIFSYVGYQGMEIPIEGRSQVNAGLAPDIQALEEVIVVGYGEQRKASVTGAIVTVDSDEIEDVPFTNLGASLVGKMPGVSVSDGTGRPGTVSNITVRNPISLAKDGGGVGPLYVIDNVVRDITDFNNLDPSEVESISVLKDASAAIYGARASQGVVLVKTKRGQAGAPRINYNGSYGITDAIQLPTMMNGYQQAQYLNTYNLTRYEGDETRSEIYTPDELTHFQNNNYNWLKQAWKPSNLTRHALNISGGSERATYYAGASYVYQNGNFDNIGYDKWTYRASADVNVTNNLKLGVSLSGDFRKTEKYFSKINSSDEADMVALLHTPQFIPPYVNGYPVLLAPRGNEAYHFFEVQNSGNYKRTNETGLNINVNLDYDIPFIKGLSARAQYSRIFDNKFHKEFGTYIQVHNFEMEGEHNHVYAGAPTSSVRIKNGDRIYLNPDYQDRYQLNAYLTYDRTFGLHEVKAIAVMEKSESYWEESRSLKEGIVDGGLDYMFSAFGGMDAYGTAQESATLSYLGRLNYNYATKYLAELAFRFDSSTKFAPQNYWGFFPSLSLGWIISEENFMSNSFVDFLKLRGSVGLLGTDQTKAWLWRQRYTFRSDGAVFGGNNARNYGVRMEAIPNPDVTWDNYTKVNLGLDARFLDNRLSASVDYFHDNGYDILAQRNAEIPLTVGGTLPSENYARRNAFGYEVSLGWNDQVTPDFNYGISGYLAWSDDVILEIDQPLGYEGTWQDQIGRSSDRGLEGLEYLGMFRNQTEVDAFLEQNPDYTVFGQAPQPGMLYYRDIRGPKDENNQFTAPDGIITEDDMTWISDRASNHYSIGSTISASWKGLSLQMVLTGGFGGQSLVEGDAIKRAEPDNNRPVFWSDHWRPENTDATYPNPFYEDTYDQPSAFWFVSSATFRMRSFTLSYGLPAPALDAIGVQSLRVLITGTNPLNFYNPFDWRDNAGSFNVYPTLRSFSLGLNVTL